MPNSPVKKHHWSLEKRNFLPMSCHLVLRRERRGRCLTVQMEVFYWELMDSLVLRCPVPTPPLWDRSFVSLTSEFPLVVHLSGEREKKKKTKNKIGNTLVDAPRIGVLSSTSGIQFSNWGSRGGHGLGWVGLLWWIFRPGPNKNKNPIGHIQYKPATGYKCLDQAHPSFNHVRSEPAHSVNWAGPGHGSLNYKQLVWSQFCSGRAWLQA